MQRIPNQQDLHKLLRIIAAALCILVLFFVLANIHSFSGMVGTLFTIASSVLYGFLFAYLLNPFVKLVDRLLLPLLLRRRKSKAAKRFSRVVGIIFAFIVAAALVYFLIELIVPQLGRSIRQIAYRMPGYYESIEVWILKILEDNPKIKESVNVILEKGYVHLEDYIQNDLMGSLEKIVVSVTTSAYSVIREIINMVIGLVVAVYVLFSKDKFLAQAKKITVAAFPSERANRMMEHARQIDRIFNGFIIGKLIDSLIIGILCYIGMAILRMPYAVLIATIIGITNIIPYFGPILGTIPCALLILLDNPLQCFYFIIFVLVLQQIDGNIIGPRILGENLGISGFWILISITIGGGMFGLKGMLLGVPVFAVIYMLISDWVNCLLQKKGKSTCTDDYFPIRKVEDLQHRETPKDPPKTSKPKGPPDSPVPPKS